MAVRLRFQTTGAVPGSGEPIVMQGASMTLGRGGENDVVLPDPDRMVSKTHCVIEDHNGRVVIVDLSTNGTFLNYGKVPIGQTPTTLNPGDVLTLGPYELVVEITSERPAHTLAPLAEGPVSHGRAERAPDPLDLLDDSGPGRDFLDDLLGGGTKGPVQFNTEPEDPFDSLLAPLGADEDPFFGGAPQDPGFTARDDNADMSDAFHAPSPQASIIPDDWDDLLDLGGPQPPARPIAPPPVSPPTAPPVAREPTNAASIPADPFAQDDEPPEPAPAPVNSAAPVPTPTAPPSIPAAPVAVPSGPPGDASIARAFLAALGAEEVKIDDADLPDTMVRLAGVLRTMVTGIREILMTRTSIKGEFRIDQTMIGAAGNNPLKFSISPEQAIEAMVRPSSRGYLPAETATDEALQDIRAHEIAMVTGMEAALKGLLKRLDPKALEAGIAKKGGVGLFQNKKAKYWETYEEMYSEVADQAENAFHDLFAREFAAAYKAQLERLK